MSIRRTLRDGQAAPPGGAQISRERELLTGAYFTIEYAIESAALVHPSIVPSPRQGAVAEGTTRFLMSLRTTGEGHVSSLVFCLDTIDGKNINFDPVSRYTGGLRVVEYRLYEKHLFLLKLIEMGT